MFLHYHKLNNIVYLGALTYPVVKRKSISIQIENSDIIGEQSSAYIIGSDRRHFNGTIMLVTTSNMIYEIYKHSSQSNWDDVCDFSLS